MNEYELHTQGARHAFEPTREDGLDVNRNKAPGASEPDPVIRNPLITASDAGAVPKPYAYEFAKSNGDGTYSVVIERGDLEQVGPRKYEYAAPKNALKEHAVKPLYDHPAPVEAGAVPIGYISRQAFENFKTCGQDTLEMFHSPGALRNEFEDAVPMKVFAAPPSAPAAEPVPQAVIDALKAWTGSEPSQSALARAVDAWRDPGAVWEHAHVADSPAAESAEPANHHHLVRELDVLLNGEDGAARQASLCDIVAQVRDKRWKLVPAATADAQGDMSKPMSEENQRVAQGDERTVHPASIASLEHNALYQRLKAQGDERAADESNPFAGFDSFNAGYRAALSRQPSAAASAGDVELPELDIEEAEYSAFAVATIAENHTRAAVLADRQKRAQDSESIKQWVCHNGGLLNEWAKDWDPARGTLTAYIRSRLDAALAAANPTCPHEREPRGCYRIRCQLGNACADAAAKPEGGV